MHSVGWYPLGVGLHRRRWLVVVAWLGVLLACWGVALKTGGRWTVDYATPGSDSQRAASAVRQHFPDRSAETIDVVWKPRDGAAWPPPPEVRGVLEKADSLPGIGSALAPQIAADRQTARVSFQLAAATSYAVPKPTVETLVTAARAARGSTRIGIAGPAIAAPSTVSAAEGVGLMIALVVLALSFGSLLAASLSIAVAGVGVATASGAIVLLSVGIDIPDWASGVAAMLGLGVGIDYTLMMLTRFREEFAAGHDVRDAVALAMARTGPTVVTAAGTVVVALGGMVVCGLGYLNGVAVAAAATVATVALAAVTLLPALISIGGGRLAKARRRGDHPRTSRWHAWSAMVQRRPWRSTAIGVAIVTVLAAPATGLTLGFPDASNDPPGAVTRTAFDLVDAAFGPGANGPLLVATGLDGQIDDLETAARLPGVASAEPIIVAPGGVAAMRLLVPVGGPQDQTTTDLVTRVRTRLPDVLVGGTTAATVDQSAYVGRRLPFFVVTVIAVSLVLLLIAFRAVPVVLKAAVMNLLSVAAGYGTVALVASGGAVGSVVGIDQPTPVPAFIPVMLFAILFGLSMDYEVFLVTRVRQERKRLGRTDPAVAAALANTGPVITAAATIMVAVFVSFAFSEQIFLKLTGIGLATAVLVDATVIRLLLLPALMRLLGEWNWWFPKKDWRTL